MWADSDDLELVDNYVNLGQENNMCHNLQQRFYAVPQEDANSTPPVPLLKIMTCGYGTWTPTKAEENMTTVMERAVERMMLESSMKILTIKLSDKSVCVRNRRGYKKNKISLREHDNRHVADAGSK